MACFNQVKCLNSEVNEGDLEHVVYYNMLLRIKLWRRKFFCLGMYATINGYHKFRVKPEEKIPLNCKREPRNRFDERAVQIVKKTSSPTEREIVVGRMPKNCANIISPYFDSGDIAHSTVFFTGQMHHGNSIDLGLGPKLICVYFFEFGNWEKRNDMMNKLKSNLKSFNIFM